MFCSRPVGTSVFASATGWTRNLYSTAFENFVDLNEKPWVFITKTNLLGSFGLVNE